MIHSVRAPVGAMSVRRNASAEPRTQTNPALAASANCGGESSSTVSAAPTPMPAAR